MKVRETAWLGTRTVAGILSMFVSLNAGFSALGVDFRFSPLLSVLYCLVPGLSFAVFFFGRPPRLEFELHALLAIVYLTVYTMLNWRACAELGYCGAMSSTVIETLQVRPVMAAFGVAIFSAAALLVDDKRRNEAHPAAGSVDLTREPN
jgi:hypothetical protein